MLNNPHSMRRFVRRALAGGMIGIGLAATAAAQTITGSFTVDNNYSVWIGDANSVTTQVVSDKTNFKAQDIRQGETFQFQYAKGCHIYVVTWSDDMTYQGMVGSFSGGATIKTGDPQIKVAASGINFPNGPGPNAAQINGVIASGGVSGWVAPYVGPTVASNTNHFTIYSPLVVPGLDPTAKWVWHDSGKDTGPHWPTAGGAPFRGFNHDEFLVWRIPCDDLVVDGGDDSKEATGCLKDARADIKCNKDGTYTVTLTGAGTPGDTISLVSQTAGITVSPPQQPWAAATSWTISGAMPGQAITLVANATKRGGGSSEGSDLCCSGEIKLTMPECPTEEEANGYVLVKKEVISEIQGYAAPAANYPATYTCSNGASGMLSLPSSGTPVSIGNLPIGTSCSVSEPAPTNNACPSGMTTTWSTPSISPSSASAANPGPTVTVTNRFSCRQGDDGGQTANVTVQKEVVSGVLGYTAPPTIFPVNVTCGGNTSTLNLSSDGTPQTIGGLAPGTSCTVNEPAPSTNVCPSGKTTAWGAVTYHPSNTTVAASPGGTVTVINPFTCRDAEGNGKPPASIACAAPKVPSASGKACACPRGTFERRGKCVERPSCVAPAKLNKAGTQCSCPRGMKLKGRTCVERERKPSITPGDVIRVLPGIGFGGGRGGGGSRGGGDHGDGGGATPKGAR